MNQTAMRSVGLSVSKTALEQRDQRHLRYFRELQSASDKRMFGGSHIKSLNRLVKKRPSDIDFIEVMFKGNESKLETAADTTVKVYKLLDVLGKSMQSGI